MIFVKFFICAGLIVLAGVRLTRYADALGEKLNWGRAWVGVFVLGFVTSLPEAVTSLSALVQFQAYDLAAGNIFGSNIFNPLLIVFMDMAYRKGAISNDIKNHHAHKWSAIFAISLSLILIIEIYFRQVMYVRLGGTSLGMWLVAVLYVIGIRVLAQENTEQQASSVNVEDRAKASLSKILLNILGAACVVVVSAIFLSQAADELATTTSLGRTFVGSIFLAIVTSLPEVVVSLSALRLGSVDLALGNIFGSNMVNIFILFLCDLISVQTPITYAISQVHVFTAVLGVLLTYLLWINMRQVNQKQIAHVGVISWFMFFIFSSGMYILYLIR